jgi:hypothetical protein
MTIRQRIDRAYNAKRKQDVYVSIHDDTNGEGFVFGFYLSDWKNPLADIGLEKELDYRLDVETKSPKNLNLGFHGYNQESQ